MGPPPAVTTGARRLGVRRSIQTRSRVPQERGRRESTSRSRRSPAEKPALVISPTISAALATSSAPPGGCTGPLGRSLSLSNPWRGASSTAARGRRAELGPRCCLRVAEPGEGGALPVERFVPACLRVPPAPEPSRVPLRPPAPRVPARARVWRAPGGRSRFGAAAPSWRLALRRPPPRVHLAWWRPQPARVFAHARRSCAVLCAAGACAGGSRGLPDRHQSAAHDRWSVPRQASRHHCLMRRASARASIPISTFTR